MTSDNSFGGSYGELPWAGSRLVSLVPRVSLGTHVPEALPRLPAG
jgi:hypothetical protein